MFFRVLILCILIGIKLSLHSRTVRYPDNMNSMDIGTEREHMEWFVLHCH